MDVNTKRKRFRDLHASGCFVLPNPWDIGGVRRLEKLGFKALASTSAGFAWSRGHADQTLTRDDVLASACALRIDRPAGERRFRGGIRRAA